MLGDNMLNASEESYTGTQIPRGQGGCQGGHWLALWISGAKHQGRDPAEKHLENQDPVWGSHILELSLGPEAQAG